MSYRLICKGYQYETALAVKDGIKLQLARKGEPGKLTFEILKTSKVIMNEGDIIYFEWDGVPIFRGILFSHSITSGNTIKCVAYDQMRYLKNKDTIMFDNSIPGSMNLIANTFGVKLGKISNPDIKFTKVEDNKSGLDMVADISDKILLNKSEMFVMFDNVGRLDYRNIETEMGVPYLLTLDVIEDFTYDTGIDSNVYNVVKVVSKTGYKIAKDDVHLATWGLLQYFKTVDDENTTEDEVYKMLDRYNRPSRNLKVKDAIGDVRIKGGSWIPVKLNIDNHSIDCPMIVEEVVHTFKADNHTMNLTLVGGKGFVA